jgi:hypothetical protein
LTLGRVQLGGALGDRALVEVDLSLALVVGALVAVDVVLRDDALLLQLAVALVVDAGVGEAGLVLVELGLGALQIGARLVNHDLERAWIDLGAQLPRLDLGVVVAIETLDDARDVGSDLDRDDRVDRARGHDRAHNIAGAHRRCDVVRLRRLLLLSRVNGRAGSNPANSRNQRRRGR